MSSRLIVIYCGLLLTNAAFAIDVSLPFFDLISASLNAPIDQVHWTITLFLFGLGIGQLLFGPLSDRIGRRRTIFIGLCLFALGAMIAAMATSLNQLLIGRLVQGLAAAAAPVAARAILRDLFAGRVLAQNMALATGIFSLGPILAPLAGVGLIAVGGSWRAIFVGMMVLAGCFMLALVFLPETNKNLDRHALSLRQMAANAGAMLRHPQSRYFMFLAAFSHISMITILAAAPLIFSINFAVVGLAFAILFSLHGLGIIVGQIANHRLIGIIGVVPAAMVASGIMATGSLLIASFAYADLLTASWLAFGFAIFAVGFLIVGSNAISMTLDPHGDIAGFASSFQGFIAQVISALAASLLAIWIGSSATALGLVLLAISIGCLIALGWWQIQVRDQLAETS